MFRTLIVLVLMTLAAPALAVEQPELTTYKEAVVALRQNDVPGLFIFGANWCVPCQKMMREVFVPLMPEIRKHRIVYFVNIELEPNVAKVWKQSGRLKNIPAYAITNTGGTKVIGYSEGYRDKEAFTKWANDSVKKWNERHGNSSR